ncbi:MAG: hypothetical protein KF706_11970 [Chitinophagales bacterium]|nr:hypothetical protein [Chitinophagales bacterium]
MLKSLGVTILGKKGLDDKRFNAFNSIEGFIELKGKMNPTRNGQSVEIIKKKDRIEITAKLLNGGRLAHDPNIGMTTIIAQTLRKLGWKDKIVVTKHQLPTQQSVGIKNKFIQLANRLNISLEKLSIPSTTFANDYWRYETEGEKLGTIFIHLVVENFTQGYSIFENHAGSEKGYFIPLKGEPIPLAKYKDREKYKAGDKSQIVNIPDLVLVDLSNKIVIDVEGKQYQFRKNGIEELAGYDAFDELYIKKSYPKFKVTRTVVLYGSEEEAIVEIEIGFLLNKNGQLILGVKAPQLFQTAIKNLLDYWK